MLKYLYSSILLLCFYISSDAQDSTYILPDAEVASNRIQDKIIHSGKSISIISKAEIESLPVQSTQDILQYVLGLQLKSRSFPFVQSDISIRGGSFDQILILIDGIKLNDAQTGHHVANIPVTPSMIERIEIIKGPAARIYGPNAYAGVIHIITKNTLENALELSGYGGSYQSGGGQIAAGLEQNNLKHLFSIRKDFGQGHRSNTDYVVDHYYYKSSLHNQSHTWTLQAGYTERKFGANGFYADPAFDQQYEEVQTSFAALQHQWYNDHLSLRSNIYWRRNQDKYLFLRNDPDFFRNFHLGNNFGVESHATLASKWGTSALGIDFRKEFLNSSNLGDRARDAIMLALEHKFLLFKDALQIRPGLLWNYYSDHGANFLPGIDINYTVRPYWSIFAAVGNTIRIPTYTDQFYKDPANIGNPNIEAEKASSYEIGTRFMRNAWSMQATYFWRTSDNLIDWTKTESGLWEVNNIQNVDFSGAEFELSYAPILAKNAIVKLKPIRLQYTYLFGDYTPAPGVSSRYVFDHLTHQLQASAGIQLYNTWSIQLNVRYSDPELENLNQYTLVDLKTQLDYKEFSCFLEGVNIFNANFFGPNGTPMPGSIWRLGVGAKL